MKINFKLFSENPNLLRILAFLLALILWFFVAGDRQDLGSEVRQTIGNIPLSYRNLGQDLEVAGEEESVTLSLQGTPRAFDGLTPVDLEAYIDLSGKREGRYDLRINATAPKGLSIVGIEPAKSKVVLEDLITRQISVEDNLQGEPGGGLVVQEVEFAPKEVFIRGPRRKIDLVSKVIFYLDISGAESTITGSALLYALDDKENLIENITVTPDTAEVRVTFTLPRKDLPVEVIFDSDGRVVEMVKVEPSTVTVTGPSQLLENLTGILTEEINLKNKGDIFTVEVPLIVPENVTCKNKHVTVQVFLAGE
ncbi:MAG: hypothetical protein GX996_02740 [Firmicutes bacterium]|nr:hypothetical protein [Bacillota bacterium]